MTHTNALESLVIAGFIRGLSVRDVEAALAEALGPEATVSKSNVSRVCQAIRDEFDAFKRRDLSDVELEYLFLDGSHFKYHQGAKAEPVLVAWGIASARELELCQSLRQRCLIHRARNVRARVPKHAQGEVKADYWAIFEGIDAAPGTAAQADARRRAKHFCTRWRQLYPAAVECLQGDFEHLITYLRFPKEHWKRIRHSKFIERTFGETRRRVKVIGRLPGEQSCLSLVWAVLDRASRGWRGVEMTPAVVRRLQNLRRELIEPPEDHDEEEVVATTVTAAA